MIVKVFVSLFFLLIIFVVLYKLALCLRARRNSRSEINQISCCKWNCYMFRKYFKRYL